MKSNRGKGRRGKAPRESAPSDPTLAIEELRGCLPLAGVPGLLPQTASGKDQHISTIHRWATRGCRGVVLRTVDVGGKRYTTRQWLREFLGIASDSNPRTADESSRPSRPDDADVDGRLDRFFGPRGRGARRD
ncbi:MAG: DUF1580 domain-containing protein [Isosphaeraceae bacterium]